MGPAELPACLSSCNLQTQAAPSTFGSFGQPAASSVGAGGGGAPTTSAPTPFGQAASGKGLGQPASGTGFGQLAASGGGPFGGAASASQRPSAFGDSPGGGGSDQARQTLDPCFRFYVRDGSRTITRAETGIYAKISNINAKKGTLTRPLFSLLCT